MTSVSFRTAVWRDTLTMIEERPLFGHGVNTYMRLFQYYNKDAQLSPTYAHNCYLQITAETGILGLISFLSILGALFKDVFQKLADRQSKSRDLYLLTLGLFSGIVAFLVHSLFDTNLYSLQLSAYFWYMAGIVTSINRLS